MILDFSFPRNRRQLRQLTRAIAATFETPDSAWDGPLPALVGVTFLGLATLAFWNSGPSTHNERLAGRGIFVIDSEGTSNFAPDEMAPGPYTVTVHEGGEMIERREVGTAERCAEEAHRLAVRHVGEAICMPRIAPSPGRVQSQGAEDETASPPGPVFSIEVPMEAPPE